MLQAALKKVIGQETSQAGSLVAFDRLRFDFNFHRPLLDNELMEIEELINSWITDATLLQTKVMALTDAKNAGAIAMFGEKYGEEVQVLCNLFLSSSDCKNILVLSALHKNTSQHMIANCRYINFTFYWKCGKI